MHLDRRFEGNIFSHFYSFSSVTPSYIEPVPGWVDSLNGPVGVIVAAGKGVIRSMLCSPDYEAEVVPVDIAINALIVIAWKRAMME
jgi:fatty acyl-CoA reductase